MSIEHKKKNITQVGERTDLQLCRNSLISMACVLVILFLVSLFKIDENVTFCMSTPTKLNSHKQQELQLLLVLFRHGDRTAIRRYPFETVQWDWDYGKLTPTGMKQAFQFGQQLRPKVHSMLGCQPKPNDIQVFSTDFDRTFDTANSVLLGVYSTCIQGSPQNVNIDECKECRPDGGTRSSAQCLAKCIGLKAPLPLIPIVQEADQRLLLQIDVCQGWWEDIRKIEESPRWKLATKQSFGDALNFIRNVTGNESIICQSEPLRDKMCQNITLDTVERVWGNLQCAIAHDATYIQGYSNKHISSLLDGAASYVWHSRFNSSGGQELGREAGGILLQDIVSRMAELQGNETVPNNQSRIIFYSAHDTTVMSLLSALHTATKAHIPQYLSHVVFELWKNTMDDSLEVHITYDNDPLDWAACPGASCALEDFIAAVSDYVMPIEECKDEGKDFHD